MLTPLGLRKLHGTSKCGRWAAMASWRNKLQTVPCRTSEPVQIGGRGLAELILELFRDGAFLAPFGIVMVTGDEGGDPVAS